MNKFLKNSAIIVSIGAILFTGIVSVKDYLNSTDLKGAPPPDISIEKSVLDPDTLDPITEAKEEDEIIYRITAIENNTNTFPSVEIEDILPTEVTYISHIITETGPVTTYDPLLGKWTGDWDASETKILDITVSINPVTSDIVIENTAELTLSDANVINNTDSVSLNIININPPTEPRVNDTDSSTGTSGLLVPSTNLLNPVFSAINNFFAAADRYRIQVSDASDFSNILANISSGWGSLWTKRIGITEEASKIQASTIDSEDRIIVALNNDEIVPTNTEDLFIHIYEKNGTPIDKFQIGGDDFYRDIHVATDQNDRIIIAGTVDGNDDWTGTQLSTLVDNNRTLAAAPTSAFVAVYEYNGSIYDLFWSKRFDEGANDINELKDMIVDKDGNIILTGSMFDQMDLNGDGTIDSNDEEDGHTENPTVYQNRDAFLLVLKPETTEYTTLFAERLGSPELVDADTGIALSVHSNGIIGLFGNVNGDADLDGDGDIDSDLDETINNSVHNGPDTFLSLFEPTGTTPAYTNILAERVAGSGDDIAFDITVDSNGTFSIVGTTVKDADLNGDDSIDVIGNGETPENISDWSNNPYGGQDIFISTFEPTGTIPAYANIFIERLGGSSDDEAAQITTNSENDLIVIGTTADIADLNGDGVITNTDPDEKPTPLFVNTDPFITQFDADNNYINVWFERLGGTGKERAKAVKINSEDDAILLTEIEQNADLNGNEVIDANQNEDISELPFGSTKRDIAIAVFEKDGTFKLSKRIASAATDVPINVEINSSDEIFVFGYIEGKDADLNSDSSISNDGGDSTDGNPGETDGDTRALLAPTTPEGFISAFNFDVSCDEGTRCKDVAYESDQTLNPDTEYFYRIKYWNSAENEPTEFSEEPSSFIKKTPTSGGGGGNSDAPSGHGGGGGGGPRTPTVPVKEVVRPSAEGVTIINGNNGQVLPNKELEYQDAVMIATRTYRLLHGEGVTELEGSIKFARERGIVKASGVDPHRIVSVWEYVKMVLNTIHQSNLYNNGGWENQVYKAALEEGIVNSFMLEKINDVHQPLTRETAIDIALNAVKTKEGFKNFTLNELFQSDTLAQQYMEYKLVNLTPDTLRASGSGIGPTSILHYAALDKLTESNPYLKLENFSVDSYNRYVYGLQRLYSEFSMLNDDITKEEYEQLKEDFQIYQAMTKGKVKFFNE